MKITSGNTNDLIESVKKMIQQRTDEMKLKLEQETKTRLERTKKQAKEARELKLKDTKKKADNIIKTKTKIAKQEANILRIEELGKLESDLKKEIREELKNFVKGKKKIGKTTYNGLVKDIISQAKKKKIKLNKEEDPEGIILQSEKLEIDLRVDSLMEKLGVINMEVNK